MMAFRNATSSARSDRGFTLVEVTIILLVLVILSTIMLPQLGNFNRLARFVKVKEDLGALCASLDKLLKENWLGQIWGDPRGKRERVGLLVGPGKIPAQGGSGIKLPGGAVNGDCHWLLSVFETCTVRTDVHMTPLMFFVDTLENHFQQNDPGGDMIGNYKNAIEDPSEHHGAGHFFGWRGPYFDWLTPDPWGQRYMINVFALHKPRASKWDNDIFSSAVVCYSAGIDGAVDTNFNQPFTDADMDGFKGWYFGDDDIGTVFSGFGPF